MNDHAKRIIYNVLLAVCIITFLVSAFLLGRYMLNSHQQQKKFDDLAHLVEPTSRPTRPPVPDSTEPAPTEETIPIHDMLIHPKTGEEIPVLFQYVEAFKLNPDMIGWMKLEDSKVNYPVMQTPGRKDYYLRRDFDETYSIHGCLYAREACDVFRPSDNITIYGHNMSDGTMFAVLHKYEKKSFWEEHPVIMFDTLSQHSEYEIFAIFITSASPGKGFPYHLFVDAANEAEFDHYVQTCKDLSLYDTGITPEYGDKLITLSTCDYTVENGRLVAVARRLPDQPAD